MRRNCAPSRKFLPPTRPKLTPLVNGDRNLSTGATGSASSPSAASSDDAKYFSVVFCKASGRKHKKWEDDAVLQVRPRARIAVLKTLEGREVARGSGMATAALQELACGGTISFGGKEIEVLEEVSEETFRSAGKGTGNSSSQEQRQENVEPPSVRFHRPDVINKAVFKPFSMRSKFGENVVSAASGSGQSKQLEPVFDPQRPDALVFPRPPFHLMGDAKDAVIVDVVADPYLSSKLRPHQRRGVEFLYRCVLGFGDDGNTGAILADDMGLGKTLQTITLVWTLLRQGPWGGRPVLRRVLVLAPTTLVKNWQSEFTKWLGSERISVFAVDGSNKVSTYVKCPREPVFIISYEMFVRSFEELSSLKFDLLVCDEGHRLKNEKIKVSTLLAQLDVDRRIVLTGTPLQNDLREFHALASVVNPNAFESLSKFVRKFEEPILRSKEPGATDEDREEGAVRLDELNQMAAKFILRRTQDLISSHLPPKSEYVVFCRPTRLQRLLYEAVLGEVGDVCSLDSGCVLASIGRLRKVCNHPSLCDVSPDSIPTDLLDETFEGQGSKLAVVSLLLHSLRQKSQEKIILVSISTQVLDMLEELCQHYEYPYCRLDGSTSTSQRQLIVKNFNAPHCKDFVLLLSSKAGGTGLNLIGASRILLYDMDWNPAHDTQAMARVWRDGQTRPVHAYRLVTTGTIEEKIFQRQITKQGLGGGLVEEVKKQAQQFHFTKDELRDLFTFSPDIAECETHDLLQCTCQGSGEKRKQEDHPGDRGGRACQLGGSADEPAAALNGDGAGHMKDLMQWRHIRVDKAAVGDRHLEAAAAEMVTFLFKRQTSSS